MGEGIRAAMAARENDYKPKARGLDPVGRWLSLVNDLGQGAHG
jgi:hypothetical protein